MDEFNKKYSLAATENRRRHWVETLASLRAQNQGDVILVCEGKDFMAHRWLLEFSSPYFVTMFHSGMEESQSGKVVFKDMEAETMEIILDFIYLGEVHKMNTEDQVKKVLKEAHIFQLEQLVEYCVNALIFLLSQNNYIELWRIAIIYDLHVLKNQVLTRCISSYINDLVKSSCVGLSVDQLKDLFKFATAKMPCLDKMLMCLLNWLLNDLERREQFVPELFMCIDATRLSKRTVKSLMKTDNVINASPEVLNRMKDLAVGVFMSELESNPVVQTKEPDAMCTIL